MSTPTLKDRIPRPVRRRIARARVELRRPTAALRPLPDFLIVGGQRCGTSSLFRWLEAHPRVLRPVRKEIEYFSTSYAEGEAWYRAHFSLRARLPGRVTFEATPDYLLHPLAARRAAALVPDARIVVLLRDPVERAISQWKHMRRLGLEPLDLDDALAAESGRIAPDLAIAGSDPLAPLLELRRHGYAERGRYAAQLGRWFDAFPRDRVLVLVSEEMWADPTATLRRLLGFVGLGDAVPSGLDVVGSTAQIPEPAASTARARLRDELGPENARLARLLGRELPWQ
ncbi:MAG: sulfotransferase [Deltaproteobacteria bacterium]|nr:sulfotransferase [Deltaproteobacteria bacterium]